MSFSRLSAKILLSSGVLPCPLLSVVIEPMLLGQSIAFGGGVAVVGFGFGTHYTAGNGYKICYAVVPGAGDIFGTAFADP